MRWCGVSKLFLKVLCTFPVAISTTTHPILQISAALPYPAPLSSVITSGAMYAEIKQIVQTGTDSRSQFGRENYFSIQFLPNGAVDVSAKNCLTCLVKEFIFWIKKA